MTRSRRVQMLALAGSAGLLLGALAFQYIGGMAPCALCIWQRWPHVVALVAGAGLILPGPWAVLGALGTAGSGVIGVYHTGVERGWWEGPAGCTGGGGSLSDGGSLLPGASEAVSVPMCDVLQPFFLGLTMANWNLIASAVLVLIWLMALRRP